ncbi:glycosyltransferase family 10 domain-containing protein [Flavobacterium restrictum]|uniref:Glycosyltransferase n=1 Tax=Flavobacterium restrictum TaxID=2594428 RepID=A0A553E889_9FLAO|nr:glycosyltransferase family 10 [Flavobacterium restrictum]TRX41246.1 glycosyltransferase [Flavobacterium restrictum]
MEEIKINFIDFWTGYNKTNNYFFNLLSKRYKVVIDENPDLLFYSCFGQEYLKYKCKRIFYTGENVRPEFLACDFAFTFDFSTKKNHYRLPLYSLYIDTHHMLPQLEKVKTREEATKIWNAKSKFCCMVVSNPNCAKRLDFFKNLSKIKEVDSGGKVLNNVGGRVPDKNEFIKDYKFVISFENSEQNGYTTEKIMEPIFMDCIPIYWGNKLIDIDFNSKRFIDYNKFQSENELIDKLLAIDQNDELAIDMLMQPTFNLDKISHEEEHEQVLTILSSIFKSSDKPIAIQFYRHLFRLKLLFYKNKYRVLKIIRFKKKH